MPHGPGDGAGCDPARRSGVRRRARAALGGDARPPRDDRAARTRRGRRRLSQPGRCLGAAARALRGVARRRRRVPARRRQRRRRPGRYALARFVPGGAAQLAVPEPAAELESLSVAPAFRDRGVGSRLIGGVHDDLRRPRHRDPRRHRLRRQRRRRAVLRPPRHAPGALAHARPGAAGVVSRRAGQASGACPDLVWRGCAQRRRGWVSSASRGVGRRLASTAASRCSAERRRTPTWPCRTRGYTSPDGCAGFVASARVS